MAKDGLITRKDIIEDQALTIGIDYAENMQLAIAANKQLVASLKEMAPLVNSFRNVSNQKEYISLKEKENTITLQSIAANKSLEASETALQKQLQQNNQVWKEQNQLETALISTKRKNELATESTNRALVKERILLAESNKEIKQQARESLGLVTTYEKLNRARLEAQKRLADLLSAEKKNTVEIIIAQREYDKLDARVKAVDAATKNYSKNIGNYRSAFDGLNTTLKELISTFGLVTGVALFGTIMKDIFGTIKDFDRQLIAVGKTTNITGEDLKQFGSDVVELGENLDGISIDGLLKSAEVAGTLGVKGTDNILKFSTAIEKLKLTSDIISDEQVQNFAKFIEVSSDGFENADRLASVITELGNNMATTEAQVLSNATEIQKGVAVYNAAADGILGIGAATSALGSEAESSRSAIQSTFAVINNAVATGENLEKVLKLTGLTQAELSKQFNKDATGVFQKLVKGLSDAKDEGQNLSLVLNDLGITEKRAFTVVGSLAANYEVLENAMSLADAEYENNIALSKEVEAASQSIASIIGDIKDEFEGYILATNDANSGTEAITKTLKFFRDNLKDIINGFLKYGSVVLTFLGVQKLVNFAIITYNALKVAGTAAQISFTTATGIGTAAMKAQALAAQEATASQTALNTAVKATPWGAILAALSAVVVAYMVFNDELSKNEKLLIRINNQTKQLQETEAISTKDRDASNAKHFKAIEDEIALRRAKGENSKKLDEEEIARKKEIIQATLDVYNDLKKTEIDRTKNQIQQSEARIAQMAKERDAGATTGRRRDELIDQIEIEKEKLKLSKSALAENSKITSEEQKRLNGLLNDLDKEKAIKDANFQKEESDKAKRAREKRLKEAYDAEKKIQDDLFKLTQFRLQVAIDMNEEILKNDKASLSDRVDALSEYQQLVTAKNKEAAEYELQQLGKYNEKTGKLVRQLSDTEIQTLLNEGTIKKRLTSEQLLILEKFQKEQSKIKEKGNAERQRIIDNEASLVQQQIDAELANKNNELNKVIEAENIKFKAINKVENQTQREREKAIEEHERKIYEIKKKFALDALEIQIKAIEKELALDAARPEREQISADKRRNIEAQLQAAKTEYSQIGYEQYLDQSDDLIKNEKIKAEQILDISSQLTSALTDLSNAIFDAKIQQIDYEIEKNNEYYERQIELAGNDERQKTLLEKERAKKEKELEKQKRKEQHKAAVFEKASALAQASIMAALAVLNALNTKPFLPMGPIMATVAGALGAVQIGAILATPIPKAYKSGRKGGPAEAAIVGDGGVPEVISRPDGSGARITPNKPTLTYLQKDDVVHKSVADYNEYMRRSIMKGFYKEKEKASTYQVISTSSDNSELLDELRKNTDAIKKQKTNVQVVNKIDLGFENYRWSNINWRS
ncbi:hypothetical protein [Flavobacterium sp. UMI-01]|uniref:hypothetical protein n=1 Tax=Flavobacterium sp. UMI-01 TaxID=1441053 RepID=UPI001C7CE262|nr:hypothetical protein [Flavobacterium sp. UMI-01]GIZ08379.1 hypothetical protein FUMI01_11060 [Flavobacterium sp. UMI-01]